MAEKTINQYIEETKKSKDKKVKTESLRLKKQVISNQIAYYTTTSDRDTSKRIIAEIERDSRYIVKQLGTDLKWEIKKNPNYEQFLKRAIINAVISIIVALIVGWLQDKYQNKELDNRIEELSKKVKSVDSTLNSKK
jgi:hypothetical protein